MNVEDRFWRKVDKSAGPDGCWLWMGGKRNGYGQFRLDSRRVSAHRVAYELATGEQIGDLQIDHICHVPACVNPAHLRPVTSKQNHENRAGAQRDSRSGVRGVCWYKPLKRWQAQVCHNGKRTHVGYFTSLEAADAAVRAARCELFTHNDLDRAVDREPVQLEMFEEDVA